MAFEQKYDAATREAATARVLERRATNPKDRHVFMVVADEFGVGQQSLRAWVAAATPESDKPARKKHRPRFSAVVTTKVAPDDEPAAASDEIEAVADPEVPVSRPASTPDKDPAPADTKVTALEAEAADLRRGNDALKAAMRLLLDA